jgi:hypothetical protein
MAKERGGGGAGRHVGEGATGHGRGERGTGARRGGGGGRERGERGCAHGKTEKLQGQQWGRLTGEDEVRWNREENHLLAVNRRSDR